MLHRDAVRAGLSAVVCVALGVSGAAQRGKPGGGGNDYKADQPRPINLGVSGGNAKDSANGYCCSGTLGAVVTKGGAQYILSNTHVFAGDSTSGGNGRVAAPGDPINQAGLIDANCQDNSAKYVATLSDWAPLTSTRPDDNVDAAIALVLPNVVKGNGEILGIGTISSSVRNATTGLAVKKAGRTTGLTRSSISSLNATINVGYSNECAGASFTKQFTGQILINNKGSRFLAGGDSGSLMVEDVATNPRAVGLLYAGSSSIAVANPIQDVLTRFDVSMVGVNTGAAGGSTQEDEVQARGLARAMQVQERNAQRLMDVPGAIGHAVGMGNSPVIQVLVEEITPGARAQLPEALEGIPVVLEEVGQVRAMPSCRKK
jgi:hypothetical protein